MKECIALRDILKKGKSRTGKVEQGNIYGILKDSMKASQVQHRTAIPSAGVA